MTMKILAVLFWVSLFTLFYTYIGYALAAYVAAAVKNMFRRPATRARPAEEDLPAVTLFIAAYNEEDVVDTKMRNCLQLDYPPGKLNILWVTDGSADRTNERLRAWPRATVIHEPERRGKTAAMNRGMRLVETPVVVFTDANAMLNSGAIREIVLAFADPRVGCVAGEKRVGGTASGGVAARGEGMYWKYESMLKTLDAGLHSAAGAAGELFAIRAGLFIPMEADTLLDDFVLSLRVAMQGYRIAYCPRAYAVEGGSAGMREEAKRKVRIAAGGLQSVRRLLPLLNIFRYGTLSFQYISRRVLRWCVAPILLAVMLPANLLLLLSGASPALYGTLLAGQLLFYAAAWGGFRLSGRNAKGGILYIPYYFLFMNVNALRGFLYLRRRKGKKTGEWERAEREELGMEN